MKLRTTIFWLTLPITIPAICVWVVCAVAWNVVCLLGEVAGERIKEAT